MLRLCSILGQHIDLQGERSYVLGRGADCDIVVEDKASSRRHARIDVGKVADMASIADLKSHNGTYVDEQRIRGATPLAVGARIRIGATVYQVVREDCDDEVSLLDTGTQAMEQLALGPDVSAEILRVIRKDGESELAGQLGAISVTDQLQILSQTNRSGTVHLSLDVGRAKIEIRGGTIVSATFAELVGEPALQMIAKERTGRFRLVETDEECLRTIRTPTTQLLLSLCLDMGSGRTRG